MSLLTAATAVSTNRLVKEQYSQGKKLEAKLEELGGADAVANDPTLQAQAQSFLDASDKLMLSSIKQVSAEVRENRRQLQQALERKLEEQGQMMAQQHEVIDFVFPLPSLSLPLLGISQPFLDISLPFR